MKIIEVRDGFIKFEADENINISSFIKVDGEDKSYIAQVIQQKGLTYFAKILFLLSNNELINYDKTLPNIDAEIVDYTAEIIDTIKYETPIITGKISEDKNIIIDASAFNKKTIISIDDKQANDIFVQNFVKQFNNIGKKTIIIDTFGIFNTNKYVAGKDFKLPLDKNSLKFLYEDCLNDATNDSKSMIIEIFRDLAEYSETVAFVPFKILKTIVDDMVEKSHVFKLLVLKNKLSKLDKYEYFATNKSEVDKLNNIINSNCAIIDLSELDPLFLNRYLSFIYEKLSSDKDVQVILELSNKVSKKSLKHVLTSDISSLFITHSKFNYLNDIKNFFDNFIVTPSVANNQIFKIYSTFLKAMTNDTFLLVGNNTNYLPLVSKIQSIDEVIQYTTIEEVDKFIAENANDETEEEVTVNIEDEKIDNLTNETDEVVTQDKTVENHIDEILSGIEPQDEVIDAIDEKSNATIAEIVNDLNMPEKIDMFSEDEIADDTINKSIEETIDTNNEESLNINETDVEQIDISNNEINQENEDNISDQTLAQENEPSNNEIKEENNITNEETVIEQETLAETDEITIEDDLQIVDYNDADLTLTDTIEADIEDISSDITEQLSDNTDIIEEQSDVINISPDEDIQPLAPDVEEDSTSLNIESTENIIEEDSDNNLIKLENDNNYEINSQEEFSQNNDELDFGEIIELDDNENIDADIIVDLEDDFSETVREDADEQILNDVEKVFTTRKEDEDISDSDLDFIDELNNDDEEILLEQVENDEALIEELAGSDNDGILEEKEEENIEIKDYEPEILEKKEATTPIVPMYDADIPQEDMVESDPIEQGDAVIHAKYGSGVVEKMIKYGNKTLFSINFENIGRRLLDPTLTEIKKV